MANWRIPGRGLCAVSVISNGALGALLSKTLVVCGEPTPRSCAFTSPHVCGDGESCATDFRLPESITGPTFRADVLRRLLKSIRKQGIHAGEYLLTPDAGLLVAVGNLSFDEAIQEFAVNELSL